MCSHVRVVVSSHMKFSNYCHVLCLYYFHISLFSQLFTGVSEPRSKHAINSIREKSGGQLFSLSSAVVAGILKIMMGEFLWNAKLIPNFLIQIYQP